MPRLGPHDLLESLAPVEWDRSTARDSRLGRDVAIKVLLSNDPHDAEQLARFERDEQSSAALNHPHIASIHNVVEAEGRRVIVMKYVAGRTLSEGPAGMWTCVTDSVRSWRSHKFN